MNEFDFYLFVKRLRSSFRCKTAKISDGLYKSSHLAQNFILIFVRRGLMKNRSEVSKRVSKC